MFIKSVLLTFVLCAAAFIPTTAFAKTIKGGDHKCVCVVGKKSYSLGNCSPSLPLSCPDSPKDKMIAVQSSCKASRNTCFWGLK